MKKTMTFAWTTPRGAKVSATITAEHITRETVYADGMNLEVDCDRWRYEAESVTVNGKPAETRRLTFFKGEKCILIGHAGDTPLYLALPEEVIDEVYGEENREAAAKRERAKKASEEYERNRSAILNAMCGDE